MGDSEVDPKRFQLIDHLLDAVFELEDDQVPAFLDQACAGDESLRAEIERLIASDKRERVLLNSPAFLAAADLVQEDRLGEAPEEMGAQTLFSMIQSNTEQSRLTARSLIAGRYEILSRLGKGGMGEVWHAYDVKLCLEVALKSLRLDFKGSQDPLEFLRREVRIAREVISPNVCRIFDLVSAEDGEVISMEFVDGITLMEMLGQKGPLEPRDAIDIASQFLAGLDAVHAAGLVHRDLKPENIMITRTGRVVVMDLGIAQPQAQAGGIISGTLPYMSPEQLAGEQVDARSDIFSAGVVLAEMIHTKGAQDKDTREKIWQAIRKDPMQLPESDWKEIITRAVSPKKEDRFESAIALSHALEEIAARAERIEDRTPYPGLASYSSGNSEYFLGREQEVETIIRKSQQLHMMAIIGPSGAGKTSFLQAGLIPALPEDWRYVFVHPGGAPMVNLQQALVPLVSNDEEATARITQFEEPNIAIWILSRLRRVCAEFVLIVDRFEELFTLSSQEVQSHFAAFLQRATLEANVRVLLVMRDDFFISCKEYPSLVPIFSGVTAMLPLTGASLRRALVQPALKCGYRFEDEDLLHDILSDVEKEKGALPLLAFAASLLWEKRDRTTGQLTRKAYQEIGEVRGALAQHAENTMQRIGIEKQSIVREIFRNLITAQNTRVERDMEELLSVFEKQPAGGLAQQSAKEILRAFIDARLLTSFENRIEITHESLISNWPRLVKWRAQDAESAQMRDDLRQAAQVWNQKERPKELLWTGSAFLEFQLWRERYPGGLTALENAFAEAMSQYANRKRKQRRILVATIILVLLTTVAVIANFWQNARVETNIAQAGKLLLMGRSLPEPDRSTKLAYAVASLQIADTPDARRFAMQVLSDAPPSYVVSDHLGGASLLFTIDGKWLAVSTGGRGLQLFGQDGSPPFTVTYDATFWRFTPDGKYIVWVSVKNPRNIVIWSFAEKKIVRTFSMKAYTRLVQTTSKGLSFITDSTGTVQCVGMRTCKDKWTDVDVNVLNSDALQLQLLAHFNVEGFPDWSFDPDATGIIYLKSDGFYYRPFSESGLGREKIMFRIPTTSAGFNFYVNGEFIAISDDQDTRIYSLASSDVTPVRVFPATGSVYLTRNGRYLLVFVGPPDNRILLWDLINSNAAEPQVIQHPLREPTNQFDIDPAGRWLAVSWNSSIQLYPLTNHKPYVFKGTVQSGSFDIRFTPDGKSFLSGFEGGDKEMSNTGYDEAIRAWSVPGGVQAPARVLWKSTKLFQTAGSQIFFDIDPSGKYLIANTNGADAGQPFLIPLDGGKVQPLGTDDRAAGPGRTNHGFSFSPDGKFAVGIDLFVRSPTDFLGVVIWNLQTGEAHLLQASKGKGSLSVKYAPDGSIFSGDTSGNLYQWNLKVNSSRVWNIGRAMISSIAITKDGRYVAAVALSVKEWGDFKSATSEFKILDLKTNQLNAIHSHGNRVYCVAFDPSGTKIVSGDMDGVVRVGSLTGDTPHDLYGHEAHIADVAVDPTGKWIASSELNKPVVRLSPMPDGQPLQTLRYRDLISHLLKLTNVRVVADKTTPGGYRVVVARFPGWQN